MKCNTYDTIISLPSPHTIALITRAIHLTSIQPQDSNQTSGQDTLSLRQARDSSPEREDGSISWRHSETGVIGCPSAVHILPPRQALSFLLRHAFVS
jgi:hypothetical protein